MKIATWNLERPRRRSVLKNAARMQTIGTVGADIWVLTETNDAIRVHEHRAPSTPIENYHGKGECLTAIHGRWPIERVHTTWDALTCVCAKVTSPVGPLVVYGAVIPYANYRGLKRIGRLELATLATLRERAPRKGRVRSRVSAVQGDVRAMHARPEFEGALFQVASQFNLLEMMGPSVTPEAGVTGYQDDRTQGPACAMAAGAATIYRNYFAPVGDQIGQTASRQIDALAGLGDALSRRLDRPVSSLWEMKNGYALGTPDGLAAIGEYLSKASEDDRRRLRGGLAIGLQHGVQVTDVEHRCVKVSQAFCSALPLGCSSVAADVWEPFARLVLEASYEATLLAAAEQAAQGGSNIVLLTRIGGGVFRNPSSWINEAILRALRAVEHAGLDVRIVCYAGVDADTRFLMERWA